jgi:thiol-disulfide isomerase/thioredoxin
MLSGMTAMPKIEGHVWVGENPTTFDNLSGKVVLVHFWTYSSILCRRMIPYLRAWYEKYKDEGFVVIGIHTPEFDFENNPESVAIAVRELGISWPVLLDNEYVNWNHFENDLWPSWYLSDKEGDLVWSHFESDEYKETESRIREVLGLHGEGLGSIDKEHLHDHTCNIPTPEVYCGYLRGNLGNELGFSEEEEFSYQLSETIKEGEVGLSGTFFSSSEYVESLEIGAILSVFFVGNDAYAVLCSDKNESEIEIFFDGFPLNETNRGIDVDEKNRIILDHPGMYHLMRSKEKLEGVLGVRAVSGNFRAYIFTFFGCVVQKINE